MQMYTLYTSAFVILVILSVPLEDNGGAGGVVDLDVVV